LNPRTNTAQRCGPRLSSSTNKRHRCVRHFSTQTRPDRNLLYTRDSDSRTPTCPRKCICGVVVKKTAQKKILFERCFERKRTYFQTLSKLASMRCGSANTAFILTPSSQTYSRSSPPLPVLPARAENILFMEESIQIPTADRRTTQNRLEAEIKKEPQKVWYPRDGQCRGNDSMNATNLS
jgi:hypothetical protein